jgi:hypothetical protein
MLGIIFAVVIILALWANDKAAACASLLVFVCGASAIAAFPISRAIVTKLHSLHARETIDTNNDFKTGLLGLLGVFLGVIDIATALYFSAKLAIIERAGIEHDGHNESDPQQAYSYILALSCLLTLATTMLATGTIQMKVLRETARTTAASEWLQEHYVVVARVCVLPLTRLENLRVLKTEVCGHSVVHFPYELKHFRFCQKCSWYHHVVEDFPRICISVGALLGLHHKDAQSIWTCY